jgi:tetratricopeptide (TPR) repeat protein
MRMLGPILLALLASGPGSLSAQGRIRLPVGLGELEQRVKADSNDAAAHYNVALGYWNERRFDEVERELKTALQIEPRFAPAHLALGYLHFGRRPKLWEDIFKRNWPDSVRRAVIEWRQHERAALLIDPTVNLAIIGATRPGRSIVFDAFEDAADFYEIFYQGYDDVEQGRYDDAYYAFNRLLELYRDEVSRNPDDAPEGWIWWRAMAASRIPDKYEVALNDLRRVLERTEGRERSDTIYAVPLETNEIRYIIANVYHRANRLEEAVRAYREVLERDLGLYMANVKLGDIFEAQRRYPEAIAERQRAVNANPDDPSLHLDLGVTLGKAGQFDKAVESLNLAATGSPRDPRPVFWLGLAHLQLNHRDEARNYFNRFIAMAPSRMSQQVAMARQQLGSLQ